MAKEDNASGAMQREALEQKLLSEKWINKHREISLHCLFDDLKLSNLSCLSNFNSKKDSLIREGQGMDSTLPLLKECYGFYDNSIHEALLEEWCLEGLQRRLKWAFLHQEQVKSSCQSNGQGRIRVSSPSLWSFFEA